MPRTIQAIYEDGVLKPLDKLNLSEHQKVGILILEDELPLYHILKVAEQSGSYDFLKSPEEDIYSIKDGEGIDNVGWVSEA